MHILGRFKLLISKFILCIFYVTKKLMDSLHIDNMHVSIKMHWNGNIYCWVLSRCRPLVIIFPCDCVLKYVVYFTFLCIFYGFVCVLMFVYIVVLCTGISPHVRCFFIQRVTLWLSCRTILLVYYKISVIVISVE